MVSRKAIVNIVKLVLVAGLITLVLFQVDLRDRKTVLDTESGEVITSVEGRIVGPWDVPTVQFVPATTGTEEYVETGKRNDGTAVQITPGFWTVVRGLDFPLFIAGALCYLFSLVFSSVRWWWLLRVNGIQCSVVDSIRLTWIGVFFNNVVPGQTGGDLVKAVYIARYSGGQSRVPAVMSVIVDRILGLASLAILGAVVVLFYLDDFWEIAISIWSIAGVVMLMGVVAFSKRIRRMIRLDALLKRLPLSGLLQKIDQAVYFYRQHKAGMILWLLAGVFNHAVSVTSITLVGFALHVGMPVESYFVLIPVINIASAVPIGPAGWGVGEVLYGSLFEAFGRQHAGGVANVMFTRAVALSVLYRMHLMGWSLFGGLLVLFDKNRVTLAEIEHEQQEIAEEESRPVV